MQDIILGFHLLTLAFVAVTIFQADSLAFSWIRGYEAVIDAEESRKLHKRTWIGLALMIATGVLLFWPGRDYLLTRPQFFIKMAFVLALIVNGFIIGSLQKVATEKSYASLSAREKLPLFISGAVSTISWAGAAIMAFFLMQD